LLRIYAIAAGSLLLVVGLAGFAVLPRMNAAESFFHVAVGALYAYLGFWQKDPAVVRSVVGGMGVLLLLSKGAVILFEVLIGQEPPLFSPVEVVCIVVGLLSLLVARLAKAPPAGPGGRDFG
jgi:hypothetical protein